MGSGVGSTTLFADRSSIGQHLLCKFQQVGSPIGLADFTVTGTQARLAGDTKKLSDEAVARLMDEVGFTRSGEAWKWRGRRPSPECRSSAWLPH